MDHAKAMFDRFCGVKSVILARAADDIACRRGTSITAMIAFDQAEMPRSCALNSPMCRMAAREIAYINVPAARTSILEKAQARLPISCLLKSRRLGRAADAIASRRGQCMLKSAEKAQAVFAMFCALKSLMGAIDADAIESISFLSRM